ncbi:MAG: hypothetical protein CSA53_02860 [Gammaproteobacteria bacterium]|nr:MAG: hypothetical protein CSA53_02860 [Gammaproteobacteria bacterium]
MRQSNRKRARKVTAGKFLVWFLLALMGMEVSARASATDVHEIADICMLANRVLKDYAMVGMGVTYHDPATDLKNGAATIDKYIADVISHDVGDLKVKTQELADIWNGIKGDFLSKPEVGKAAKLRDTVAEFTKKCETLAFALAEQTQIEGEKYVVEVSELGMDTQHLGALYMLKAWGVENSHYYDDVEETINHFEALYADLSKAPDSLVSPGIKKRLKTIDDRFLVFGFMANSKSGRFMPTRAEKILSDVFVEIREILKLEQELVE